MIHGLVGHYYAHVQCLGMLVENVRVNSRDEYDLFTQSTIINVLWQFRNFAAVLSQWRHQAKKVGGKGRKGN